MRSPTYIGGNFLTKYIRFIIDEGRGVRTIKFVKTQFLVILTKDRTKNQLNVNENNVFFIITVGHNFFFDLLIYKEIVDLYGSRNLGG